ncbi:NUDIX hydrolase [Nocardioides sp. BP30]|uniref:NUDIX hydrolase n=1 Tax=Nocardioides sp. BP30 TaxID=3036374 RepID=UPI002468DB81|nr:NUDIX hydrolase [Nocardioides sp. BP30]WGL50522.1 NUDIX hydrolase [Nocardioides sp. BP30]
MPDLRDTAEQWPIVSSQDLHRDDWVMALRRDTIRRPGSDETFSRLVLEHPGAAVILALDDERRVLCLKQYRHPAGMRFVELPAGLLDADGEEPLQVAQRELREEASFAARTWRPLTAAYSSPGILGERIHYFVATDLTPVDRGDFVLEHEEADMELMWVPFDELYAAVLAGEVTDGPLIIAVLMVRARDLA